MFQALRYIYIHMYPWDRVTGQSLGPRVWGAAGIRRSETWLGVTAGKSLCSSRTQFPSLDGVCWRSLGFGHHRRQSLLINTMTTRPNTRSAAGVFVNCKTDMQTNNHDVLILVLEEDCSNALGVLMTMAVCAGSSGKPRPAIP